MKKSGLILSYGEVGTQNENALSVSNFEDQMKYLHSIQEKCYDLSDLEQTGNQLKKSIFITIDGGNFSDIEVVAPILNKFNLKATFFIPANKFEAYDAIWEDYAELIKDGHQIGSMGLNSSNFAKLNVRQQMYEIKKSKYILEQRLKTEINYFALPKGRFNHHTIRLASDAQYKMVFSSRFGFFSLSNIPFLTNRWKITNKVSLNLFEKVTQEDRKVLISMKYKYIFGKWWNQLLSPISFSS